MRPGSAAPGGGRDRPALGPWILRAVWGLAALGGMPGCQDVVGFSERHVQRTVASGEIVGSWRATPESLARLGSAGYPVHVGDDDHRLAFREDGSCRYASFWIYAGTSLGDAREDHVETSHCRWELARKRTFAGRSERDVTFLAITLSPGAGRTLHTGFYLAEEGGRLVLWAYIGQPGRASHMEFIRDEAGRAPPGRDT